MRFRSIHRVIRRGHLVWIDNTDICMLELFRIGRYKRVYYYGVSIPNGRYIPTVESEAVIDAKPSLWQRFISFVKKLF